VEFSYTFREKLLFYLDYFYRKVFALWFEVKSPRLKMFVYEMLYSARKLVNYASMYPSPFRVDHVETVFGSFWVRPGTVDMSNVSPAFERRDVDYLLALIDGLVSGGKRVLFLDVGADLGTYSVTVGNRFVESGRLGLAAFEPAASSFAVLRENVAHNGLEGMASLHNVALWDKDGEVLEFAFNKSAPGSSGVSEAGGEKVNTATLDTVLGPGWAGHYDALVMKMDVEGAERRVLQGARDTLALAKEVYLLVEDFVEPAIIAFLKEQGWEFLTKKTPYNSFWRLVPRK
jgi:FkbM family methyltransferase